MEIEDDYQPYIYFIATIGFCLGYLLFVIDGYYHFKYIEFGYIGRKDLIARLGVLAHAIGFMFYPASLIFVAFMTLKSTKSQNIKAPTWPFSLLGVILVGACFYTGRLDSILFIRMEYWLVGVVLMMVAALLFWNKIFLNRLR